GPPARRDPSRHEPDDLCRLRRPLDHRLRPLLPGICADPHPPAPHTAVRGTGIVSRARPQVCHLLRFRPSCFAKAESSASACLSPLCLCTSMHYTPRQARGLALEPEVMLFVEPAAARPGRSGTGGTRWNGGPVTG